jgi:hypothetical protein
MCELDPFGSEYGSVAGCCEYDNKSSSFIKGGKFLGQVDECDFLKKDRVP